MVAFSSLINAVILTSCNALSCLLQLDYAARMKKIDSANKSYDQTVECLKDVFAKA